MADTDPGKKAHLAAWWRELTTTLKLDLRRQGRGVVGREGPKYDVRATELAEDVYIDLRSRGHSPAEPGGRRQFLSLAFRAMKHRFLDNVRRSRAWKRGGRAALVSLEQQDVVDRRATPDEVASARDVVERLPAAIEALRAEDEVEADIVERFRRGQGTAEIAAELGMSPRWVQIKLKHAAAWLERRLDPPDGGRPA